MTITYNEPPHRFEAGTPPIVQAIGLGAALDYIEALGRDAIDAHEHEIADYAAERLKRINSLRLIGDAPGKGGIFSFEIAGRPRPRRLHHPRSLWHRGARRHPLRHAAAEEIWRHLYLPGLVRPI